MMTKRKSGSAWIGILILLIFISSLGLAIIVDSITTITQSKKLSQVIVAQSLCDAGIEKTIWELNNNSGYTGEENYVLPTGEIDISISGDFENKEALITSYVPSEASAKTTRTVRAKISAENNDDNFAFHYGIQVGESGLDMSNNSKVIGNVYSGGSISGGNGSFITGSVLISGEGNELDNVTVGCQESDDDNWDENGEDLGVCPIEHGDAHVHTISDSHIYGDAMYMNIIDTTVVGSSTSSTPPPNPLDLPITDVQISQWKSWAEAGGTYNGNYIFDENGETRELGPKKIDGNLSVSNNATLVLNGVIWVTGDIDFGNNAFVELASTFGENSGMIIADGTVTTSNNAQIKGSGDPKSYIMILSNATGTAITVSNNSSAVVYYSGNGTIDVANNAVIRSLSAKEIKLSNGAMVIYDTGLASASFSAGPGGNWSLKEWQVVY